MASTGVGPDLVEQFAKLRPILSDPAHHDATFGILVSLGLPKAHWVKPPWNYNIEKERFKAAFTVDKANPDSHMDDQPKYTSFVMKLLHLDKKYAKVQELSDNTLVDSLKFVLSFCSTVKQADLQVSSWSIHKYILLNNRNSRVVVFRIDDEITTRMPRSSAPVGVVAETRGQGHR